MLKYGGDRSEIGAVVVNFGVNNLRITIGRNDIIRDRSIAAVRTCRSTDDDRIKKDKLDKCF